MNQGLRKQLQDLTPVERTEAIQLLVGELAAAWPGIEKQPDVCGGDACVVRTRIPVWVLEQRRRFGSTVAEILEDYPSLNSNDVRTAWTYADVHPDEMTNAIADNQNLDPDAE